MRGRRARAAVLALAVALAVPLAACSSSTVGPGAIAPRASSTEGVPTTDGQQVEQALSDLVRRHARAVAAGEGASDPTVAGDAPALRSHLAAMARQMRAAGVDRYTLDLDPKSLDVMGDRATFAAVGEMHLRRATSTGAPVSVQLVARREAGGWRLVDGYGGQTLPQPWDLPGLRRVDAENAVVVGNAPADQLEWYASAASAAWTDDEAAWPHRPDGVPVLVVPSTLEEAAAQLRRTPADLTNLAALTVGSLARGRTARGDHVVVAPAMWTRLTPEGRRTILRHELVHVAIRGTTTAPVPQWLTEGYATQASWAGSGVPAQLAARVRGWTAQQLAPVDTPSDAEVETGDPTHAYDASALLVDDLVRRHGRAAVVQLYERLASGQARDAAARAALHESFADVLRHWRERLAQVAGR